MYNPRTATVIRRALDLCKLVEAIPAPADAAGRDALRAALSEALFFRWDVGEGHFQEPTPYTGEEPVYEVSEWGGSHARARIVHEDEVPCCKDCGLPAHWGRTREGVCRQCHAEARRDPSEDTEGPEVRGY